MLVHSCENMLKHCENCSNNQKCTDALNYYNDLNRILNKMENNAVYPLKRTAKKIREIFDESDIWDCIHRY